MTQRIAGKTSLFTVPDNEKTVPALFLGRCTCGYLFFPPHRFGCESCGAGPDAITITEATAQGVLKSFALAQQEAHPKGSSPYVIGQVVLDAGPEIGVLIETEEINSLSIGQRVRGKLVPVKKDKTGRVIVDCLFTVEGLTDE